MISSWQWLYPICRICVSEVHQFHSYISSCKGTNLTIMVVNNIYSYVVTIKLLLFIEYELDKDVLISGLFISLYVHVDKSLKG